MMGARTKQEIEERLLVDFDWSFSSPSGLHEVNLKSPINFDFLLRVTAHIRLSMISSASFHNTVSESDFPLASCSLAKISSTSLLIFVIGLRMKRYVRFGRLANSQSAKVGKAVKSSRWVKYIHRRQIWTLEGRWTWVVRRPGIWGPSATNGSVLAGMEILHDVGDVNL